MTPTKPFRSLMLAATFLLITTAACGRPEQFESSDPAPSRSELIARLHSPADNEELRSFRIRLESEYSGGLFAFGESDATGTGKMSMNVDVTTDPRAVRLTARISDDSAPHQSELEQMIVVEGHLWSNRGEGWYEEELFMADLADWLLDSFTDLQDQHASNGDSPQRADILREAEIIGHEEVNGYRTAHFRITTPQMLAMKMANYEAAAERDVLAECEELDAPDEELAGDPDELLGIIECWSAALAAELPPPNEYIERFEVDLWVADEGFVMRERTELVYSGMPFPLGLEDLMPEGDAGMTMTSSYELYDLNADFTIEVPDES